MPKVICAGCATTFLAHSHEARWCSDRCRMATARRRARGVDDLRRCGACRTWFHAGRSDAQYCSGRCRVAAWRHRQRVTGHG